MTRLYSTILFSYRNAYSHLLMTEDECPLFKGWMYPFNIKHQPMIPYSKALLERERFAYKMHLKINFILLI